MKKVTKINYFSHLLTENFEINVASRILTQHRDKVLFNNCPKCGKLTRTPMAKQCRHCGYDWHQ